MGNFWETNKDGEEWHPVSYDPALRTYFSESLGEGMVAHAVVVREDHAWRRSLGFMEQRTQREREVLRRVAIVGGVAAEDQVPRPRRRCTLPPSEGLHRHARIVGQAETSVGTKIGGLQRHQAVTAVGQQHVGAAEVDA